MYRTRFASLRVPEVDDTDQAQGLLNLSTDIQYAVDRNMARVDEIKRRRGVYLWSSLSTLFPNTTTTLVEWSDIDYDTDGYVDLSTSLTNVTVPPGVFLISGTIQLDFSGLTVNTMYALISGSTFGPIAINQFGPAAGSAFVPISLVGLLYSQAGETVTMTGYQISGATVPLFNASLVVSKIGNL